MRIFNNTKHYTISEIVGLIKEKKYPEVIVENIKSVAGLRALFAHYGHPKGIMVGTTKYYEWDKNAENGGAFEEWMCDADTKREQEYEAKVLRETGHDFWTLIDIEEIIRGRTSKVTFYNYYNKSENPPQKFTVGLKVYFLVEEMMDWLQQFPLLAR